MIARLPGPSAGLKIGLFGGSFDPAHDGHAHVAATALRRLQLDWVWWIPALGNPLKSRRVDFRNRFENAQRLIGDHPRMRVSDVEAQLGTPYTIQTLTALKRVAPAARFVWIMGGDNLMSFHRWADWKDIASRLPIAVIARPGAGPRARFSTFAQTFRTDRLPEAKAPLLPHVHAPAWVYLKAPWNTSSSTSLRRQLRHN